jgi:putative ABC transport system permease protein
LGFNKEQVVVILNAAKLGKQQQVFKERMKQYQGIVSASYTDCLPQMMLEVKPFQKVGSESYENHTLITIMSDYDFMDTYQFEMIDGRFFEKTRSADSSALLLNEAAVKSLNLRNPLQEQLTWLGLSKERMEIIGILRDFHLEPLHMAIRPMASMLMRAKPGEFLSIRIKGGHIPESIRYIEAQWNNFVPQQPLEYVFFDDQFGQIYQKEIQAGRILTIFASLAIIIACLGLYGLASFTAIRRIKEIGIRRVFGASGSSIFVLLSKEFTKWVALSNLIAWPIAWYAMNQWLQNFAYRINISWWIFVFAGMMALLIALLTVSWQAVRVATANPVQALRYE